MSFAMQQVAESHPWRAWSTFFCGLIGAFTIAGVFFAPEEPLGNTLGVLGGLLLIGLCLYTYAVTNVWKSYNPLYPGQKAITWVTVAFGALGFLIAVVVVVLLIAVAKAVATAVERSVFLR